MNNVTQKERIENVKQEEMVSKSINNFCKTYKLGQALKRANAYKSKGIAVVEIFLYLLQLVYTNKSMFMNILTGTHKEQFAKDVVYRLLNSPHINWCRFMLIMANNVITTTIKDLTSDKRLNAIAIDDTFYARLRSKKVELLANVFDHASKGQKYKKGFRLLTFAWTDGVTLIPLMFRHLSTENKKCRYNEANEKIDKRTAGYKARKQAVTKGTLVVIELLAQAVKMGIPAKHVIFDSWFSNPTTIIDIKKIGLDVVGRLKNTPTIKYLVNGTEMTLSQIFRSEKKRRGMSKYLLSVPVQIYTKDSKKKYTEILDARIVYVRDRNDKKKWIAFLTTDLSLTEEQVIELYGKRWDIEVFFKMCKSYLNLGKEFQGLSYDSMTAHTAVVMIRYMMLAVSKRQTEDPRSLGELFFFCYDEMLDVQFAEALVLILELMHDVLLESLFLSDEQISSLIDAFISKLPAYMKGKMIPKSA